MPPKRKAQPASPTPPVSQQEKKQRKNAPTPTPQPQQSTTAFTNPEATGPLYQPLPHQLISDPSVPTDTPPIDPYTPFLQPFIHSLVAPSMNPTLNYDTKVKNKVLLVDNPPASDALKQERRAKLAQKKRKRKNKVMSAKERKEKGIWDIQKETVKWELFVKLHDLWSGYMAELLEGANQPAATLPRLLKADYHGALFTVVKSKCPTLVGISGIVMKETENMFYVVTKQNAMKVIPKRSTVFTFETQNKVFTLYGNHFISRAGERVAKKFKEKPTVDLL